VGGEGGAIQCLPPLPRYLHKGCCEEEGHCEGVDLPTHAAELLGKCQTVRKNLKEYMVSRYSGTWVLDTVQQMFPECTNLGSMANGLKTLYARDNVHLTKEGPKERFFSVKHKRFSGGALRPSPYGGGRGRGGHSMPPPSSPYRGGRRF